MQKKSIQQRKRTQSKHFNTRVHLKYNNNFNMRRSKQIMRKFKKQFFFLFSNTGNILSTGKHQTKMSFNSAFSSFSFFSLSFTWRKESNWGVWKCSYNIFNNWWNRTFTVFRIHITFKYLRFGKRKRFELYLSLADFRSQTFLFTHDFFLSPRARWKQRLLSKLFRPRLKILFQISLTCAGLLARRFYLPINHPFFFHHLAESYHSNDLDLCHLSLQQAKMQGV